MNFESPYKKIGTIPDAILTDLEDKVINFEKNDAYNFTFGDWRRIDSYHNPDNHQLEHIIGSELIDHVMQFFPDHVLFGWSISYLPGKSTVVDHIDRMMFHRFAKRIIIPITKKSDVLNWHYSRDKVTRRYYFFEYGNVYRLNTAATHGLANAGANPRRAIYLDVMERHLYEKFKTHPDILKVILMKATGEISVL
jgi:hypothetical protein